MDLQIKTESIDKEQNHDVNMQLPFLNMNDKTNDYNIEVNEKELIQSKSEINQYNIENNVKNKQSHVMDIKS